MNSLVLLVPLLPFLGFLINGIFRKSFSKSVISIIGCTVVFVAFVISLVLFFQVRATGGMVISYFDFISVAGFNIPFAFQIDQLSAIFLLIITGIGFLIHLYSTGYMHDETSDHFGRFFSYLNLFVFSMLLLVMGANFVIMFVGWEGVGLCSYLLIGYWFKNDDYTYAGKKAFVMNRIGDVAFLLAIFWMFKAVGSSNFSEVFQHAGMLSSGDVTAITLLLFVGAVGKSAQIPLYTWLPDAMAGPTPVSALIHAATMVTAGIYLIARSNVLYSLSEISQNVVAVIGLATALLAASIALYQNDIKKVLAYSTVSQLGLMFLAMGVGAYTTGVFHVMTHAFFKALLFLGAGSVIHAMGGEQDITKMGGLRKKLPVTYFTFLIAVLAISGFPFTSGFMSKDEILIAALSYSPVLFWLAVLASILTAIYMFRLLMLVFFGGFRGSSDQLSHLHESPVVMTLPLVVLAVLSAFGGFIQLPHAFGGSDFFNQFLSPVVPASIHENIDATKQEYYLLIGTMVVLAAVIFYTYRKYAVDRFEGVYSGFKKVLADKWYIDELYDVTIVKPLNTFSSFLKNGVEKMGIDGVVNGIGRFTQYSSRQLRLVQSGQVGSYLLLMVFSIVILFLVFWNQEIIVEFLQKIF